MHQGSCPGSLFKHSLLEFSCSSNKGFERSRKSVRSRVHHIPVSDWLGALKFCRRFENIGPSCGQDVLEEDRDRSLEGK
jgi:hypothetical protein